jgi:hypothetical protein
MVLFLLKFSLTVTAAELPHHSDEEAPRSENNIGWACLAHPMTTPDAIRSTDA